VSVTLARDLESEVKSTCLQSYASKGPLRDLCLDKAGA
jgi:hypothetical protein